MFIPVILFWVKKVVKKGVLRKLRFEFSLGSCKDFLGMIFWAIFDGFFRDEKVNFEQKVAPKNAWVVSFLRGLFFSFFG